MPRFNCPGRRLLILFLVLFAVQNCVKNLKNALYACSSITSQVGTSNPRASRSRERPRLHHPSIFSDVLALFCRYNPVLGEFFRCRYDYPNGTQGFFIAEQGVYCTCVRDHPPPTLLIRTYLFSSPNRIILKCRTIHLYPPSTMFHQRTRSPSSASFDQSPSSLATPSRR